jgi:hypothetical protein
MNLFYDPSISGLRQMVATADKSLPVHNIVVDYDGEAIIGPETKFAGIKLNRFKLHTRISQSLKGKAKNVKILFETMLAAFDNKGPLIQLNRKLKSAA